MEGCIWYIKLLMYETSKGEIGAGGGVSKEEDSNDTTREEKSNLLRSSSAASRECICFINGSMPK